MRFSEVCESCLYSRQEEITRGMDNDKRTEYLKRVKSIIDSRDDDDSAPYMVYLFHKEYREIFGPLKQYAEINKKYNNLVLSIAEEIEREIDISEDPVEKSIAYARVGNYIDFGAMEDVNPDKVIELLNDESMHLVDKNVYFEFIKECSMAKQFLLICDNSGEIVLDKLFVRQLKKKFPELNVTVMVRGDEALNDATMNDAVISGMTDEARVITNGNAVAGTVLKMLSPEAYDEFKKADVILSKGQGNYETLTGCGKKIYYSFLCKCDVFTSKFDVPRLTGMFLHE